MTVALSRSNKRPSRKSSASSTTLRLKRKVRQSRPLHRRVSLHPATIMTVLIVMVILVGLTSRAIAESFSVNAVVPAAPLTAPATIDTPLDGASFREPQITVRGSCPADSYVKLNINGTFSGVAMCDTNGRYGILTRLFAGNNVLTAQDYTTTNDPGPAGRAVKIYYSVATDTSVDTSANVSGQSQSSATTADNGTPSANSPKSKTRLPLLLLSDFRYQTFLTGRDFSWPMSVQGGRAPFSLDITWGDKQSSSLNVADYTEFSIKHRFERAGYFPIIIKSIDARGGTATIQLAALIKADDGSAEAGSTSQTPSVPGLGPVMTALTSNRWLLVVWPVVGLVLLMIVCFLLGERKEYEELLRISKTKKA